MPSVSIYMLFWIITDSIAWILSNTSLAGNNPRRALSSSIRDFMILKSLNITIHPPLPSVIKEVIWHPPLEHWVKCNTDGAANNLTSFCAGIFKNHNAEFYVVLLKILV
jgi:hypothetical protein